MEEAPKFRPRFMRKEEIQALEVFLAYSDFEAEFNHWVELGEPNKHIWPYIRHLLDFLHAVKPDTELGYPTIQSNVTLVPALPYDSEVIENV